MKTLELHHGKIHADDSTPRPASTNGSDPMTGWDLFSAATIVAALITLGVGLQFGKSSIVGWCAYGAVLCGIARLAFGKVGNSSLPPRIPLGQRRWKK
jgi:hypothetical protein